jgi:hypothetical protein
MFLLRWKRATCVPVRLMLLPAKGFSLLLGINTFAKLTESHELITPALLGIAVVFSSKAIADQFSTQAHTVQDHVTQHTSAKLVPSIILLDVFWLTLQRFW